jgi:integrase
VLREVGLSRYPLRDRVMVLLSVKAGLRAKEIALLTWGMVLDADGNVGDVLELHDNVSKGKRGGRQVPLHPELRAALIALATAPGAKPDPEARIIHSERDIGMSGGSMTVYFHRVSKAPRASPAGGLS